ncbi:MAG: deoxyhypusine synthase [Thermoprotei archaeon]|nr:MAG: deoxyhypusine synthase [Thermoprotei archaeon]
MAGYIRGGESMELVEDLELTSDVKRLVKSMAKTSFNARRLGEALEILEHVVNECELRVLSLAGAVTPSGFRRLVGEALRRRWFNVLITTGANITHDLLVAFGGGHYRIPLEFDDRLLKGHGVCRIYDIAARVQDFELLEKELRLVLEDVKDGVYSTHELIKLIGLKLRDEGSLVRSAAVSGAVVIVPAFYDSILGVQVWSLTQTRNFRVVEDLDLSFLINAQFDMKKKRAKTGILIVGGGVPKNFALQSALVAGKPFDYAVQITIDPPHYGGLSGATLSEAVSWGKVEGGGRHCTVYCDFTIALPLLFSALA